MNKDLKVLVVDDTVTYRQILSNIVSEMNNVELTGSASNGRIALSKIELSPPDVVLLDVSMPVMDGLETLRNLKSSFPEVEVLMVSGMSHENADVTVKALELGALDFIPKPQCASPRESISQIKAALSPLIRLAITRKNSQEIKNILSSGKSNSALKSSVDAGNTALSANVEEAGPVVVSDGMPGKIDIVALGVSTGGPNALQALVPAIEAGFPVPIMAVQHMPPNFTASLADRLDKTSSITVVEANDNQDVSKGVMYIAPGGRHMVVRKNNSGNNRVIGLVDSPPVNSCRPAVDVLFRSVGMVYNGNVLTVILTGMGNDGVSGVASIRRKGGYSIVQDEQTSVVWGMPGAVAKAKEADEIVLLDKIAGRIMEIVKSENS